MGTGWRRAFCTRDPESIISDKQQRSPSPSPSPRSYVSLGFLTGGSNPSSQHLQQQRPQPVNSPSLRCQTAAQTANDNPRCQNKTTPKAIKSAANSTSPRSPLKLCLFKNSFKFRSSCGICLNSVKTGQGTAIYTAECAHAFHFPCITDYVRKHGSPVCPVCNTNWKDVPLLAAHKNLGAEFAESNDVVTERTVEKPIARNEKKRPENSSPVFKTNHVEQQTQLQQQQIRHSDSTRPYDDDEPLLSPTSGGRIIPIPEADENDKEEEDEVEDFQGFFVIPKPPSTKSYSHELQMNNRDSRNIQVKLMPECALISVSQTHKTYALVIRVKAPPPSPKPCAWNDNNNSTPLLDPLQRAPIDLVAVLDVGGSTTGAKMHMLKHAMRLIISSLGPADRLSLVAFSATPKRLLPLRRMTLQGQRVARRIIDRLVSGQGSFVGGDALRKAAKVLEDRRERNPVATVMLLSDGQDERVQVGNNINQWKTTSHVSSTRFSHIEISVHSYGFGQKSGYSHEPIEDAFAKRVGGLLSVVFQDLRIQLGFQSSSAPAEISAIYSFNGRPTALGSGSVRLGDLYAYEERELLVELRLPISAFGTHHVMTLRCLYKDPASQEVVFAREQALLVLPPESARYSGDGTGTRTERLRNLFITTRSIAESRRLVEHNDFTSAHHLLSSARALLMQSNSISNDDYVRGLEAELAELHWRRQHQMEQQMMMIQRRRGNDRKMIMVDENGEPLTPTSAWRVAEKKKSLDKVSDLHGFENARF